MYSVRQCTKQDYKKEILKYNFKCMKMCLLAEEFVVFNPKKKFVAAICTNHPLAPLFLPFSPHPFHPGSQSLM